MVNDIVNPCIRKSVVKTLFAWAIVLGGSLFIRGETEKYLQLKISQELFGQLVICWTLFILFLIIFTLVLHRFKFLKIEKEGIMKQTGILAINQTRVQYECVTHSTFNQTILDRILGIGTLQVDTAGTSVVELIFQDIEHTKAREIIALIEENGRRGS